MRSRGSGNADEPDPGGGAGVTGWFCLPLSIGLAVLVALAATRLGPRAAVALRTGAIALLLPGLALALWPHNAAIWAVRGNASADALRVLACRTLGTLPLLALPVLVALGRMPPGQARIASGLGAGRAAQLQLLWLPQLGPACLAGLLLAVLVDATSLRLAAATRAGGEAVLSPPAASS